MTDAYHLFYKWFDYLKEQGHLIIGYQIMPNHVHTVIAFKKSRKSINTIIGNGKRFIGYEIIKRLQGQGKTGVLKQLEEAVVDSDKKRGKLHEVWENSFDWKECRSREMILQKLNYMHANPCKGKWNLVDSPVDYVHGSAKYYITGEQGIYPVTNYMLLDDVDLTEEISFTKPPSPADDISSDK